VAGKSYSNISLKSEHSCFYRPGSPACEDVVLSRPIQPRVRSVTSTTDGPTVGPVRQVVCGVCSAASESFLSCFHRDSGIVLVTWSLLHRP
jgi:hypothetical protein